MGKPVTYLSSIGVGVGPVPFAAVDDPASLIRSIELIPFRAMPATGAEYAAWATAALTRAQQALVDAGLDEVHLIPIDVLISNSIEMRCS